MVLRCRPDRGVGKGDRTSERESGHSRDSRTDQRRSSDRSESRDKGHDDSMDRDSGDEGPAGRSFGSRGGDSPTNDDQFTGAPGYAAAVPYLKQQPGYDARYATLPTKAIQSARLSISCLVFKTEFILFQIL